MRSFLRLRLVLLIASALVCPAATRPLPAQQQPSQQQTSQPQPNQQQPGPHQEQQEAPPSATIPYVLHVYTNRVQIPALILTADNNLLPALSREQFTMRLDSGPPFHPTRVRLQGDDPIALMILLDAGGSEELLLRNFDSVLAGLVPTSLNPRDRVDLLAADCTLVHISNLRTDPETLRLGVQRALASPGLHTRLPNNPRCPFRDHVWDALGVATRDISSIPGRKVVLAITTGDDFGSHNTWNDLADYANSYSIAIFAVRSSRLPLFRNPNLQNSTGDALQTLCSYTGGVVLETYPNDLARTMQHFFELFRNRYILEFPRPRNSTAGHHGIDIAVPNRGAVVRASGTTVMLPSDEEKADPNRVSADEINLPAEGTRRPSKRR